MAATFRQSKEVTLFTETTLTSDACAELLAFYQTYQEKNWTLFLSLRESWAKAHPELPMRNALCANIQPMTGAFRPLEEQRIWCWGDGRALNIWSYCLLSKRVPEKKVTLTTGQKVSLKEALEAYCDDLYAGSWERYTANGGTLPVSASPASGKADDHPWNPTVQGTKTFSNLFTVSGWALYGMLKDDFDMVEKATEELEAVLATIEANIFSVGLASPDPTIRMHGPRMIALGVVGEILKGIDLLMEQDNPSWEFLKPSLIKQAIALTETILDGHYSNDPVAFWEKSTPDGKPVEVDGVIQVDPGHATEFAGFLAEVIPFLPEDWGSKKWNKKTFLKAALDCHLYADRVGFSARGVMYKSIDLKTEKPLPDTQALNAGGRLTAPWWNVREHCAAALKLFTLTGDNRLIESYRRGQFASYTLYPNATIMDQMIQTVDPETGTPLDIAPATGNLDAMHDSRARIREMENLELILENNG